MKLISVFLTVCLLASCAANNQPSDSKTQSPKTPTTDSQSVAKKVGENTQSYDCEENAQVVVRYGFDTQTAVIYVNAPSWKLTGQEITLSQAKSASGERYVNDSNPASVYEWLSKGDDGVLSVMIGSEDHSLICQAKTTS